VPRRGSGGTAPLHATTLVTLKLADMILCTAARRPDGLSIPDNHGMTLAMLDPKFRRPTAPRGPAPNAMRHEMKAAIVAALLQAEGQGDEQTASELLAILSTMPERSGRPGRAY
jgi:hypothetical protein